MNIDKITVQNEAIYRSYITSLESVILVENYTVQLNDISIFAQYTDDKGKRHSYKFTNNLDITLSIDLIANPRYYVLKYGS